MLRTIRSLRRRTRAERRLLYRATLAILVSRLALKLLPFGWVKRALVAIPAAPASPSSVLTPNSASSAAEHGERRDDAIESVGWAVDAAGTTLPGTACLSKAIAAHVLLRRQGYPSTLHVGVDSIDQVDPVDPDTCDDCNDPNDSNDPNGRDDSVDDRAAIAAHSWVEHRERAVVGDDEDLSRYTSLLSIESEP